MYFFFYMLIDLSCGGGAQENKHGVDTLISSINNRKNPKC